jgi:uncharacterized repeat protein (TIGR01451 family)
MALASVGPLTQSPTPMRFTPAGRSGFGTAGAGWLMLAIGLVAGPVFAQAEGTAGPQDAPVATGSGPLTATIEAETLRVVEQPDGSAARSWEQATRLSAGDEVYYTIRVHNPGKAEVADVVVTKRLPLGVHYKRGSAVGPACDVQFSIDGGNTFAPAGQLGAGSGGKPARKVAPSDYTHVRWILSRPLAPGATALLRFRATFT